MRRRSAVSWWQVGAALVVPLLLGALLLAIGAGWGRTSAQAPLSRSAASTDGFRFWDVRTDGSPVRWNPCAPIQWTFDPSGAPPYGDDLVAEAVDVVEEVTGLDFLRLPDRAETPSLTRSLLDQRDPQAWAPVLITWAPPHTGDIPLRTSDRAVSVPVSIDGVFVTGQVVLNSDRDDLRPAMGDRSDSWGATLVHELGHLVGLDHVDDEEQLMSRFPGAGPAEFGPGDLDGLAQLGADSGCLDAGPPRDLRVDVAPRS